MSSTNTCLYQALYCLAGIIATGLLPALVIAPATKERTNKEEIPTSTSLTKICDVNLVMLLASHFLGKLKENEKYAFPDFFGSYDLFFCCNQINSEHFPKPLFL